jgi:RNA polymerase sigma-70 factor (ECF subfamily)
MKSASGSSTNPTLLGRLRQQPTDQSAWAEFVAHYGKKIYGWCRRWHLQDADAADVTQAVLLKLARQMQTFVYDPAGSFRGWLKTLTHHAWHDLVARRRELAVSDNTRVEALLQSLAARDDLVTSLEAALDQEMLEEAMGRVRLRVQPHTWHAFRLTALEGRSGPEAAADLGLPLTTVYKAKSNVQKLLQEELRYLERTASP